ncbi:hypothetical protein B0H14DRAFT_3479430 [Mycena olivaceomarginata]|nr:hypothetical protein B0H14DRAFT_3479430 [Mycena olivaceomarginata]
MGCRRDTSAHPPPDTTRTWRDPFGAATPPAATTADRPNPTQLFCSFEYGSLNTALRPLQLCRAAHRTQRVRLNPEPCRCWCPSQVPPRSPSNMPSRFWKFLVKQVPPPPVLEFFGQASTTTPGSGIFWSSKYHHPRSYSKYHHPRSYSKYHHPRF